MPALAIGQSKSTCGTLPNAFSERFSYVKVCISESHDKKTRVARETSGLAKISSVTLRGEKTFEFNAG